MRWKQTGMCGFSLDVSLSHKHLVFSADYNAKSRLDSCRLSPQRRSLCFTALHSPEREPRDKSGVTAETLLWARWFLMPPPPVFHFVLWMDYIWSRCVLLFSLSNWTCWETGRPLLIYCTTIKRLFSKTHLQHWCPPQWNESLSGLLQFEAHPRQTKNRRGRQLEEIIMTHVDICCVLNFASTMLVYKPLFLAL